MRPVTLTLQAFGSYADRETLDFAPLAELGLFVVTGPTGSGKTTVFDAMSFALYGSVPGDRPDGDVRSHHADDSVRTEVTLVFDVDGQRYRVFRRPRQMRPKRTGRGFTEVPAEAELHRQGLHGWEPVETSVLRVGRACADLIGLKADQFQKVVLLPQGRFAEFLLASSSEREGLLRQLFGTAHIERATRLLLDRARELEAEVDAVRTEVDHHRRSALAAARHAHESLVLEVGPLLVPSAPVTGPPVQHSLFDLGGSFPDVSLDTDGDDTDMSCLPDDATCADIGDILDHLTPGVDRLADIGRRAAARAAAARDAAAQADDTARRVDQYRSASAEWTRLTTAQTDIERAGVVADAGRRARPVVAADTDLVRLTAELDAARRTADDAHTTTVTLLDQVGVPPVATVDDAVRAVAALGTEVAAAESLLTAVRDAEALLLDAVATHRTADEAFTALDARLAHLAAERTALAAHLDALGDTATEAARWTAEADRTTRLVVAAGRRDAASRALADAVDASDHAEQAESALLRAFAAAAAPRLAATLVPGEACMVCGSTDHPAPALADSTEPVDDTALQAARRATVAAHARRTELTTALRLAREDMGDHAAADIESITAENAVAEQHLSAALDASRLSLDLKEQIRAADAAMETARPVLAEAADALAGAQARVDLLTEQFAAAQAGAAAVDPADVARRAALVPRLDDACRAWTRALSALDRRTGEHRRAEATAHETLHASGFADVAQAHAAFVSDEEQVRLERQVDTWRTDRERVRATLDVLAAQGVPDERPDTERCARVCAEAEGEAARVAAALTSIENSAAAARQSLSAAVAVGDASTAVRTEAELTARVARVCTGQVAPKISLETWVLSRELERVAQAANVHLDRMTGGRYVLRTLDGITEFDQRRRAGLDLVVFDAHTGRERSPRTLSGGEQFQAALALALGLADVVSRGGAGSGKVFEALFVDEGFGSLDPDALDQAIDALSHLQAGGRMVGVITHVEAMKHQLPTGVRVERRADGCGSTLVPV